VVVQNLLDCPNKLGRFAHSHVHALYSHRPGLMGRVSNQPATALPESLAHAGLKLHLCAPVNFPDRSLEPRRAFRQELLHMLARLQLKFRLVEDDRASLLARKFIYVCRR
jgi:hypothetical protein